MSIYLISGLLIQEVGLKLMEVENDSRDLDL